jgi:hypothetical protein
MPTAPEVSPETALGRFFAGFFLAGIITCLSLSLYPSGRDWSATIPPAVVVGILVGALSTWGKRWFAFFVELFTRFGL